MGDGASSDLAVLFHIVELEAAPRPAGKTFIALRSSRLDPNPPDPAAPDYEYVTAELGNSYPKLKTRKTEVVSWETFQLIDLGDGTARLQARNGEYIEAKNQGGEEARLRGLSTTGAEATFEL